MSHEKCGESSRCYKGSTAFFGRLLLSLIFILAGIGKIIDFQGATETLRSFGIQGAEAYILVGLLLELIGGILILLGLYTRLGIYLLMIFMLPTTFIFHGFWNYTGAEMAMQLSIFLRNIAIYGGLLLLHTYGPGYCSLDYVRCKKKRGSCDSGTCEK